MFSRPPGGRQGLRAQRVHVLVEGAEVHQSGLGYDRGLDSGADLVFPAQFLGRDVDRVEVPVVAADVGYAVVDGKPALYRTADGVPPQLLAGVAKRRGLDREHGAAGRRHVDGVAGSRNDRGAGDGAVGLVPPPEIDGLVDAGVEGLEVVDDALTGAEVGVVRGYHRVRADHAADRLLGENLAGSGVERVHVAVLAGHPHHAGPRRLAHQGGPPGLLPPSPLTGREVQGVDIVVLASGVDHFLVPGGHPGDRRARGGGDPVVPLVSGRESVHLAVGAADEQSGAGHGKAGHGPADRVGVGLAAGRGVEGVYGALGDADIQGAAVVAERGAGAYRPVGLVYPGDPLVRAPGGRAGRGRALAAGARQLITGRREPARED